MTPPRPDVELLAALDAGSVDEAGVDAVEARAALADPAARPVLDALAATRADLAQLADTPVPRAVATRWSAALRAELTRLAESGATPLSDQPVAGERGGADGRSPGRAAGPLHSMDLDTPQTGPGPPSPTGPSPQLDRPDDTRDPARRASPTGPPSPTGPRTPAGPSTRPETGNPPLPGPKTDRPSSRPPGRRGPGGHSRAWRRPAVVGAVALLVVFAVFLVLGHLGGRTEQTDLVDQGLRSIGIHDAGPYADDGRRAECLRALAPPDTTPTAPLIGGRQVTFAGRPGVLLVLRTGRRGVLDIVVVDPRCTTLLAAGHVGG